MSKGRILFILVSISIIISCKNKSDPERGTEFPQEFLGVWEADQTQDPDNEGIFTHFKKDTVTYYGRIGDADDPSTCYFTSPLFEIVEFEGDLFTLKAIGNDEEEEPLGELTIRIDGNIMEWVFAEDDKDRWNRRPTLSTEDLTPPCEGFKVATLNNQIFSQ